MKKKLRSLRLGAGVCTGAALLAVLAACGGSAIPETDRVFLSAAGGWDRNHDGIVTCDEWKAYAAELFDAADANHDGFVDRNEYATIVSTDRMFQTVEFSYYDTNGDGKLDRAEFVEKPNAFILRFDRNGDCRVTGDEIRAANAPKGPQGPAERPRDRFH